MTRARSIVFGIVSLGLSVQTASATPLTVSGTHPTLPLSAQVTFDTGPGNALIVTLANIRNSDVQMPFEILTTLYFDIAGAPLVLTPTSAVVPQPGNSIQNPPATPYDPAPTFGVGGEWEWVNGMTNAPFGQDYSLASSGLGLDGTHTLFPGANLSGPTMVDGAQYGITSPTDDGTTGNSAVTSTPFIKSQVKFTLTGLPANFDPSSSIFNIQFQYGTTRCDTAGTVDRCVPDYPEPGTLGLLAIGSMLMLRRSRRAH